MMSMGSVGMWRSGRRELIVVLVTRGWREGRSIKWMAINNSLPAWRARLYICKAACGQSFTQANAFPMARPIPRQSQACSAVSIVRLDGRPGWLPDVPIRPSS